MMMHSCWIFVWIPHDKEPLQKQPQASKTPFRGMANQVLLEPKDQQQGPYYSKSWKSGENHISGNHMTEMLGSYNLSRTSSTMSMVHKSSHEETLLQVLNILSIDDYIVHRIVAGQKKVFQFFMESEQVEPSLVCLIQHGFGVTENTMVNVVPTSVHFKPTAVERVTDVSDLAFKSNGFKDSKVMAHTEKTNNKSLEQMVDTFYASVKSHILVAEVITRIERGTKLDFDYMMYLFLASILSALGLFDSSPIILVASTLLCPLAGPLLAIVFGVVVNDSNLRNTGIKVEIVSILLSILLGLIIGMGFSPWIEYYGVTQWPSIEMVNWGRLRGLMSGVFIAVLSGAGVALSVLCGNTESLVGVAITISLLPPAVNAGLLWALSLMTAICGPHRCQVGWGRHSFNSPTNQSLYVHVYSSDVQVEMGILGLVSLTLAILNIISIIITGVMILKLKEVTPDKIPLAFPQFWKNDIRTHRLYYKTIKKGQESGLLKEVRNILGIREAADEAEASFKLEGTFLKTMFEEMQNDSDLINIRSWSRSPVRKTSDTGTLMNSEGSSIVSSLQHSVLKLYNSTEVFQKLRTPSHACSRRRLYSHAVMAEKVRRTRFWSQCQGSTAEHLHI